MSAGGTIPGPQQQNPQPQNPSLPPADYSMGYARNFQTPSFYNPFSGYYGANQSYGGGFAQPFGGFGGFGQQFSGFQQPQYGGFEQPQFGGFGGGFQQPQFGGFQQPQYGGFQQPQYGGGFSQPSFRNPFGRGFNPRTMPPQMQPQPPQQRLGPQSPAYDNSRPGSNDLSGRDLIGGGMGGGGGYGGGFNPMMGGLGGFGGFQQQFNPYGNAYAEPPQQAQRGTIDQNMNNPAFKQQQDAYNMTDYQRLMQRKDRAANAPPAPPMSGMMGLGGMPITAPRDYDIAQSLGYGDSGISDMRAKMPEEYKQEDIARQARAKSYLDSIGYGQTGFDPSKYEVKREVQPFSGFGSLFSGLGRG